jgi:hypothetical protein
MQKTIPMVLAFSTMLALILCCACVSQPAANQTSQNNVGFTQIIESTDSTHISFEEAKAQLIEYRLKEYRLKSLNNLVNASSIYYMHSKDMDGSGNATVWIFGVYDGAKAEFLVYDRTGWATIGNMTLPEEKFNLDNVVSPALLFKQNNAMILGNTSPVVPQLRDLELQKGVYMLTITSGDTSRTLTFNATTGALII